MATTQGNWTPTVEFFVPGDLTVAYQTRNGVWTNIDDKLLMVSFSIVATATFSDSTGNLRLLGLPKPSVAGVARFGSMSYQNIDKVAGGNVVPRVTAANPSMLDFVVTRQGGNTSPVNADDVQTGQSLILNGSIFYEITA